MTPMNRSISSQFKIAGQFFYECIIYSYTADRFDDPVESSLVNVA